MAVVYNVNVRNARLQQVINAIDAGPGNGQLKLGTAGMALLLSTIVLNKPCGTILNGVLTFSGTPLVDPAAVNGGLAGAGQITDSAGTVVVSGLTVGLGGPVDIVIDQLALLPGSVVTFTAGTITGN